MLSNDEQAQVLELGRQGLGPTAIARGMGRKPTNIQGTYKRYVREGLLAKRDRGAWKSWTAAERDQLHEMVDSGYSYDLMAKKLGRSRDSVIIEIKRRYHRVTRTPATYSARDVAQLLGIGCSKTVSRWIRRGWLKARNAGRKDRPLWRIKHLHLYDFLENPNYWMAWDPDRVTDRAMREWAQELRRGQPRWLTEGEVARRYHVGTDAVRQWISKGFVPAARYGNHYINERDLEGWVPPCERSRAGIPLGWKRRVSGKTAIRGIAPPAWWPPDGWIVVGQIGGVTLRRRAA